MNPTLLRLLLAGGAGGGPSSSDIVNPPGWLAHLKQRSQPQAMSSGGGATMPLPSPQSPISIASHPVMSQPLAAPGPVDHTQDMNPFSSMASQNAAPFMGAQAPQLPMGLGSLTGAMGQGGQQFPTPMLQPGASQGFGGVPVNAAHAGPPPGAPQMPQAASLMQQPQGAPPQGAPAPQQPSQGAQGGAGGYGSFQGSPLMSAGNSLMSMLGLGPNAGQPSGMQGNTQGPALIQKFMQMLHGGAGQSGMPF